MESTVFVTPERPERPSYVRVLYGTSESTALLYVSFQLWMRHITVERQRALLEDMREVYAETIKDWKAERELLIKERDDARKERDDALRVAEKEPRYYPHEKICTAWYIPYFRGRRRRT